MVMVGAVSVSADSGKWMSWSELIASLIWLLCSLQYEARSSAKSRDGERNIGSLEHRRSCKVVIK